MPATTACLHCDTAVTDDDRFCPGCGRPLPARRVSREAPVAQGDVDLTVVAELRREKERLDGVLGGLLDTAEHRQLTAEERAEWTRCYPLWRRVCTALTREMQYLAAREEQERRQVDRRQGERRQETVPVAFADRRSGTDRRRGERRSGVDRRDPFPTSPA